jgi:Transposase DDE domain
MHLAIDEATGEILAVVTTERASGDCEKLPDLLDAIGEPIEQVSADGAYDTIACHQAIAARNARAAIPPRETAVVCETGEWDAVMMRCGGSSRLGWRPGRWKLAIIDALWPRR